jgi:hypothetical protein
MTYGSYVLLRGKIPSTPELCAPVEVHGIDAQDTIAALKVAHSCDT